MKRNLKPDKVQSKSILSFFSSNKVDERSFAKSESSSSNDVSHIDNINECNDESESSCHTVTSYEKGHYSIKNFDKILTEIFHNENDIGLFNDKEKDILMKYQFLSISEKKLFIKIYAKPDKWHRLDKDSNCDDNISLNSLVKHGFLNNDINNLNLLSRLQLLQVHELDKLMKKFNVNNKSKKRLEKIHSLIAASDKKHQISKFFVGGSSNTLDHKLSSELRTYLHSACRIKSDVRRTFCKLTVLFCLTDGNWEEIRHLGDKNQRTLFFLLQIERGEVVLPLYRLSRVSNVFTDGPSLNQYVTVLEYFLEIRGLFDQKKYDDVFIVYQQFSKVFPAVSMTVDPIALNPLPCFLSRFSAASVVVDTHSVGVSILEKCRLYAEAVSILKSLLTATDNYTGVSKRRGKWYFRLCLNLKFHLKDSEQSRLWLEKAIKDSTTPPYFKLTFQNRIDKLEPTADEDNESLVDMSSLTDNDVVIERTNVIHATINYKLEDVRRPEYLWIDDVKSVYCHVEDYVILHYIGNEGFTNGLHGETNTFIIYYFLLFYDVIYADVPDVFYTYRQTVPLDLFSGTFKLNRSTIINEKFDWFRNIATENEISDLLVTNWMKHSNEMSTVFDWRIITDDRLLIDLFWSVGLNILLQICEKFVDNFSYWSSGMPDLVMWNSETRVHEIIEVKGPGDKLSDKQKLWIVELQSMGANVSLCKVMGVSHKKI